MKFRSIIRAIGALAILAGLSACQSTTTAATDVPPEPPTPVDIESLISGYVAANPGEPGIPLLNTRSRGFILNADNTMTFDDLLSIRELLRTSAVTFQDGNRICMDRLKTWTGACLDIFRESDGTIRVFYEFGNGASGDYTVDGIRL